MATPQLWRRREAPSVAATDVTQTKFSQLLKRKLGLKASDPGQWMATTIAPTYELKDTYSPENRVDRGERLFTLGNNFTNIAATSFGVGQLTAGASKMAVIKRATFSMNLPTAANQPGNTFVSISFPQVAVLVPTVFGCYKDARVASTSAGLQVNPSTGFFNSSFGVQATYFPKAAIYQPVYPGAAATPTTIVIDNCDVVLPPNTVANVAVASDTLPVANWSWFVFLEGYELVPEVGELTQAPP